MSSFTLGASSSGMVQGILLDDATVALRYLEATETWWTHLGDIESASPPAVLTDRSDRTWAIVRSTSGEVFARSSTAAGGFGAWTSIGGQITDGPSVCLDAGGRVVVFGRGTDGAVWHAWFDGNSWSGWVSLGGGIKHAPSGILTSQGRLVVFAVGTDDAIWHRFYDNGWSEWSSLGGGINASPTAIEDGVGMLWLFGRGMDNALWERHYDLGWTPWKSLGGNLASGPVAAVDRLGRTSVRALGSDARTIFERLGIAAWTPWVAVDKLQSWPSPAMVAANRAAEEEAALRDPAVQRVVAYLTDHLKLAASRAIQRASDPGSLPSVGEWEDRLVAKVLAMPPEKRSQVTVAAQAQMERFSVLQREEPALWQALSITSAEPLSAQAVRLATPVDVARITRRARFQPQEKGVMWAHIHKLTCEEETNEGGDDTIAILITQLTPGRAEKVHGPFELGDFAEGTPLGFARTDTRANYRWEYFEDPIQRESSARPFELLVTLVEVDGDLDPYIVAALTTAVAAAGTAASIWAGAAVGASLGSSVGGAVGSAVGAAIAAAWTAFCLWWKSATEDEVSGMHRLYGYRGMDLPDVVQSTLIQWDGGRYRLDWSFEPGVPINFLDNLPPVEDNATREFELLDRGPFAQIGAVGRSTATFGLWARRADGSTVYRSDPDGPWVNVPRAVNRLDNGWAIVDGAVARFDRETGEWDSRASRSGESLGDLLKPDQVAGQIDTVPWLLSGGKPWRQVPERTANAWTAKVPDWRWSEVPTDQPVAKLFVGPPEQVWALDSDGRPYEWTATFTPRLLDPKLLSVCVAFDALNDYATIGVTEGGTTYAYAGGKWLAFECVEKGTQKKLVVRQMCHVGKVNDIMYRRYLLNSQGQIYVSKGPKMS